MAAPGATGLPAAPGVAHVLFQWSVPGRDLQLQALDAGTPAPYALRQIIECLGSAGVDAASSVQDPSHYTPEDAAGAITGGVAAEDAGGAAPAGSTTRCGARGHGTAGQYRGRMAGPRARGRAAGRGRAVDRGVLCFARHSPTNPTPMPHPAAARSARLL
jgi:hypothetical protein